MSTQSRTAAIEEALHEGVCPDAETCSWSEEGESSKCEDQSLWSLADYVNVALTVAGWSE